MTFATTAFAVAALLASAQAQPGINATRTAHCVWNDAQCSDPIIHGAAEACHQSQEFCEGQCSSDKANATWCEGAPLYEQENAIASCSWADRESLDLLYQCDGVADGDAPGGDNETVQACQREHFFELSAACASCLAISEWNATECLLEATPSCSAHDAHDIFEMSACQVNHPNATQDQLEACYAGVSMDMTPGCLACLNTASWDARACILDFRDLKCTPCDVAFIRQEGECERALPADMCQSDMWLHMSDNCVGCAISNDYDFTECFPGPDQQQCSESDLHALAQIMLCPGAPSAQDAEDESAEHQACIDAATRTASDECFSCVMATGGSLRPCFQDAPAPAGQCATDDAAVLATAAVCDDLDCEKAVLAQLTQPCLECGLAAALPSLPGAHRGSDPDSASLMPFPDACLASPQQPYCRFDMDSNGMIGVDDLLGLLAAFGRPC